MGGRLGFVEPMMPTLVDAPPARGDWSTEAKFDGWRIQIIIEDSSVRVFTRRGHDWTGKLRPIADAVAGLRTDAAIIDGELVHPHESGRTDFAALQKAIRSSADQLIFMAFDLLHLAGRDLRGEPLEYRRRLLESLIEPGGRIQFSETLAGSPADIFPAAEQAGLEGIVCKRRGSPYRSGPSTGWGRPGRAWRSCRLLGDCHVRARRLRVV